MARLPVIAIVGRPNVGKSTLFNRIVKRRLSLVHEEAGVTRDRHTAEAEWRDRRFALMDTGGIPFQPRHDLDDKVAESARRGVEEADFVLFLVDGTVGITEDDWAVAEILRKTDKPVRLAVNKMEKTAQDTELWEFTKLGFGDPWPISALHGEGVGDLLDYLTRDIDSAGAQDEADRAPGSNALKVCLIGKPNVGKSSLLNALLGEDRVLVHEQPGTTRDAIDIHLKWHGNSFVFVDTAGLKRKSRTEKGIPVLSALKTLESIERSDVTVLLLDGSHPVANQDTKVASYAHEEGKGILVCVNKWDLVPKDKYTYLEYQKKFFERFHFIRYAPMLFISALTHQRISKILPEICRIADERRRKVPTPQVNDVIEAAVRKNPPSYYRFGTGKISYGTQIGVAPPAFALYVNDPNLFPKHYIRYLINEFRERFGFSGSSIRLSLKPKPRRGREGGRKRA